MTEHGPIWSSTSTLSVVHHVRDPGCMVCVARRHAILHFMRIYQHIEMTISRSPPLPRKPTNVTLPPDLLARAKQLDINVSRASERGIREEIRELEARRWAEENAELIAAYTDMVEQDGLPLAKYRTF